MRQSVKRLGYVVAVDERRATVLIDRNSACSECKVNTACHSTECKKMYITVHLSKEQTVNVGQQIVVSVSEKKALHSVLVGYCLPLVTFCTVCAVMSFCVDSDGLVALGGLVSVIVYYITLFAFRRQLNDYFSCSIMDDGFPYN